MSDLSFFLSRIAAVPPISVPIIVKGSGTAVAGSLGLLGSLGGLLGGVVGVLDGKSTNPVLGILEEESTNAPNRLPG